MASIYPLVLCGGSGSRLWPASRSESPKQFQPTNGSASLSYLQATVQRHRIGAFEDPILVTSARYARYVQYQLNDIQCKARILSEPVARNTGPAVLAAALQLVRDDPDAVMVVLPSDHIINGDVNAPIQKMEKAANDGRIVTFGIQPQYPETGYGYITDGGAFECYPGLHRVAEFVEKPPAPRAKALMDSGSAYWASGISMFAAQTIIDEYMRLEPQTYHWVKASVENQIDGAFGSILDGNTFQNARNAPTESAIFENSDAVALAPLNVEWSDVGSWAAVYDIGTPDENGNVTSGDVITLNTTNSLVKSEDRLVTVVGMSDVIVVDTPDALLVTNMAESQSVKQVFNTLRESERREAVCHVTKKHAWGESRTVFNSHGYDVSLLKVRSGEKLSLDGGQVGRTVMAVNGPFQIDNAGSSLKLSAGERLDISAKGSYRLTNTSDRLAELMVIAHQFKNKTIPQEVSNA